MTLSAFKQLAALAEAMEERIALSRELNRLIDALKFFLPTLKGESDLAAGLAERLDRSRQIFEGVKQTDAEDKVDALLTELGETLGDVDWDIARDFIKRLQSEVDKQTHELDEWKSKLGEWQISLKALTAALDRALEEGVHLRIEEDLRNQLDTRVEAIRSSLADRNYTQARNLVEETGKMVAEAFPSRDWNEIGRSLETKIEAARGIASQADLLLLKSESGDWIDYTVLLRTASRPGSHGVNIQGSSKVFKRDRENFSGKAEIITKAVNEGRARALGPNPNGAQIPTLDAEKLIRDTGKLLYRLVVPDEMQGYLSGSHCSLTVTSNDLELPWELMYDGRGFLCMQRPVGRMPMGYRFPRGLDRPIARPVRKRMLFIADPNGNLEGARKEIETIQEALKKDQRGATLEVRVLEGKDVTTENVNDQLLSGELDIIHYCGHANFEEQQPEMSALLLHQGDLCNAQKIRRILEGHPLVFLNACRSGAAANEQPETDTDYVLRGPAEGLASAFIYGGALGCVGALWPVYDEPAAHFAIEFYRGVLRGEMIGEALWKARIESWKTYPNSITWASFVLYGDPIFSLLS